MTVLRPGEALPRPGASSQALLSGWGISLRGERFVPAALALLAVAAVMLWVWARSAELRALAHLPLDDRRALYQRTLQTLRSPPCRGGRFHGLRGFCRREASFIVGFPECDRTCRALAAPFLLTPAR